MGTEFCLEALHEAIAKYGVPAIFNTDCGAQYQNKEFIEALQEYGREISNDGIGRCKDNIRVLCEGFGNAKVSLSCFVT